MQIRIDITDINPDSWVGIATLRERCDAQAASENLSGLDAFFRGRELFAEALGRFPTYKERSAAISRKSAPVADPFRAALHAIADGHNDPRALAVQVLNQSKRDQP